jgi:hypothetical protein
MLFPIATKDAVSATNAHKPHTNPYGAGERSLTYDLIGRIGAEVILMLDLAELRRDLRAFAGALGDAMTRAGLLLQPHGFERLGVVEVRSCPPEEPSVELEDVSDRRLQLDPTRPAPRLGSTQRDDRATRMTSKTTSGSTSKRYAS